jgi:Ca-activated chloride channel family protein
MTTPAMIITARRPALLAGHDNELDVLVRVQAPDAPAELPKRNPLHLALVIDRSGSMSGQPLDEAKRCAEFVLDGLQATDRLSLVVYDNQVQTLVPTMLLHDKEFARRAIRAIDSGGSTDLHGGWFQGAETLAPHTKENITSRVILLSDGCANHGLLDHDQIHAQCAEFARAGVSTSTYGLGHGFNEELMIGMARHGQGSSYYGQTADDLMDPFREEFELLNALCARRLRLEIAPAAGVKAKMLNDYVADGANAWLLPNLAFGGEAWAVIRLRVPSPVAAGDAEAAALSLCLFSLRYTTLDGEPRAIQPMSLALPVLPASAFGAITEDELVARRTDELEAAYLQTKARAAARRGDWAGVARSLKRAERIAANNPWVAESLNELRELAARKDEVMFAKESAFSARAMSTRLAGRDEMGSAYDAPASAAYLRRKGSQGKAERKPPQA